MLHLQITGDLLLVGLLFIHYYPTHHIRGKGGKIGTPHSFWVAVANLHAASLPAYCFPTAARSRFDALQSHQTGASCMTWDTPWATGIQAAVPYSAPQQLLTGFHVGSQVYAVLLNVAVAIIFTSTNPTEEGAIHCQRKESSGESSTIFLRSLTLIVCRVPGIEQNLTILRESKGI